MKWVFRALFLIPNIILFNFAFMYKIVLNGDIFCFKWFNRYIDMMQVKCGVD